MMKMFSIAVSEMLFYKFQKPGALQFAMLRRGELFFASPAELNDPNECRPRLVFNGTAELWRRLAHFLLERLCFYSDFFDATNHEVINRVIALESPIGRALKKKAGSRDIELAQVAELFAKTAGPLLEETLGKQPALQAIYWLRSRFIERDLPGLLTGNRYIASFCQSATNPTMWGHYADAERGFALVFTATDGSISVSSPIAILSGTRPRGGITELGHYKEERLSLKPVEYSTKPPKVNAFHRLIPKFSYSEQEYHYDVPLLLPGEAATKQENLIGLLKYSEWRYEREVRAFFPGDDQRLPPDARSVRVASENIKGLIFGPNMSPEHMMRAVVCAHLLRAEQPSLQPFMVFRAKRSPERFRLSIEPEGILHGRYDYSHIPIMTMNGLSGEIEQAIRDAAARIALS